LYEIGKIKIQFVFGNDTKIPKDIEKKKRFVSLSIF
jgi:hypothetical protein